MNGIWTLPDHAEFLGKSYKIHGDFRDILEIFEHLENPDLPEYFRWRIALALFYDREIPAEVQQEAMDYLAWFIRGGQPEPKRPGPKLLDWQQDAPEIIADINRVAGKEIRQLPFLHWWTFLSWFHSVGEGQLSTILSIRKKKQEGKKLEKWEAEFCREQSDKVELRPHYSRIEQEEREKLLRMLELTKT